MTAMALRIEVVPIPKFRVVRAIVALDMVNVAGMNQRPALQTLGTQRIRFKLPGPERPPLRGKVAALSRVRPGLFTTLPAVRAPAGDQALTARAAMKRRLH